MRGQILKQRMVRLLLNGGGPGERETQENNEKERPSQIPISQGLTWIFSERIREHHQLQFTYNPRQISFYRVQNGLR